MSTTTKSDVSKSSNYPDSDPKPHIPHDPPPPAAVPEPGPVVTPAVTADPHYANPSPGTEGNPPVRKAATGIEQPIPPAAPVPAVPDAKP